MDQFQYLPTALDTGRTVDMLRVSLVPERASEDKATPEVKTVKPAESKAQTSLDASADGKEGKAESKEPKAEPGIAPVPSVSSSSQPSSSDEKKAGTAASTESST